MVLFLAYTEWTPVQIWLWKTLQGFDEENKSERPEVAQGIALEAPLEVRQGQASGL